MQRTECTRLLADINQINTCTEFLKEVEPEISEFASILNLAGNEVRLKILFLISKEEKLCVCDLSDILGMNISAVSQHLRKLKDGMILTNEKDGQTIFYSLHSKKLSTLKPLFALLESNVKVKV